MTTEHIGVDVGALTDQVRSDAASTRSRRQAVRQRLDELARQRESDREDVLVDGRIIDQHHIDTARPLVEEIDQLEGMVDGPPNGQAGTVAPPPASPAASAPPASEPTAIFPAAEPHPAPPYVGPVQHTRRQCRQRRRWGKWAWIWAFTGLVIGLLIAVFTYGFDHQHGVRHGVFTAVWFFGLGGLAFFTGGNIGSRHDQ